MDKFNVLHRTLFHVIFSMYLLPISGKVSSLFWNVDFRKPRFVVFPAMAYTGCERVPRSWHIHICREDLLKTQGSPTERSVSVVQTFIFINSSSSRIYHSIYILFIEAFVLIFTHCIYQLSFSFTVLLSSSSGGECRNGNGSCSTDNENRRSLLPSPSAAQPQRVPSVIYITSNSNSTTEEELARSIQGHDIPRASIPVPVSMARSLSIAIPIVIRPQIYRDASAIPPSYEEATADHSLGESSDDLDDLEGLSVCTTRLFINITIA